MYHDNNVRYFFMVESSPSQNKIVIKYQVVKIVGYIT